MNARGPIIAAISLAFAFLNVAFILIIMDFEFIALTIILVYIGAIIILFLFIIMLLHIKEIELREQQKNGLYFITLVFFYINFITVILMVVEFESLLFLNDTAYFNTNYNYLIIDSNSNFCMDNDYEYKLYFISDSSNWNNFLFSQKEIPNITEFSVELSLPRNFYYYLSNGEISVTVKDQHGYGEEAYPDIFRIKIEGHEIPGFPFYRIVTEETNLVNNSAKHKFPRICEFKDPKLGPYSIYMEFDKFNFYRLQIPPQTHENVAYLMDKCRIYAFQRGWLAYENYHLLYSTMPNDVHCKIGKFINFKHLFVYNEQNIEPMLLTHIKNIIISNCKDFKPTLRSYNTNLELRTELHSLGLVMYTYGCIYLILVSVLLLIALLGAVILITLDTTEFVRLQQSSNQNAKGINIHIS